AVQEGVGDGGRAGREPAKARIPGVRRALRISLVLSTWCLVPGPSLVLGPYLVLGPWSTGIARAVLRRMGVNRFEDLRVWQAATKQSDLVGELLMRPEFQRSRRLSDDMDGAALSVMLNISEGFLRRRNKETLQFLRYAFSSNGELKSAYYAANGRK